MFQSDSLQDDFVGGDPSLTAATGTGSAGTLKGLVGSLGLLAGITGTGSAGALILAPSQTLSGVAGSGSAGVLTALTLVPVNLVGVAARGSVGNLFASSTETNLTRLLSNGVRRLRTIGFQKPSG